MEEEVKSKNLGNKAVKKSRKKTVLISLLVLLLIAGLSAAIWFWQQQKIDELTKKVSELTATVLKLESEDNKTKDANTEKACIAKEGQKVYKNNDLGFCFVYPNDWEDVPKISDVNAYIEEQKYRTTTLKYDPESKSWVVAKKVVDESTTYNAGDPVYDVTIARKDQDFTVYNFGFGDAGCGNNKYVFVIKDKVVSIESPVGCSEESGITETGKTNEELEEESEQVLYSIQNI